MTNAMNPVLPATYDLVWSAITLALLTLTLICLVQAFRNRGAVPHSGLWMLAILLVPGVGAVGWLIVNSLARDRSRGVASEELPAS